MFRDKILKTCKKKKSGSKNWVLIWHITGPVEKSEYKHIPNKGSTTYSVWWYVNNFPLGGTSIIKSREFERTHMI